MKIVIPKEIGITTLNYIQIPNLRIIKAERSMVGVLMKKSF
jgi:hypothetical protein